MRFATILLLAMLAASGCLSRDPLAESAGAPNKRAAFAVPEVPPLTKKVSFEFIDIPVPEACAYYSEWSGIPVTCDKALADLKIRHFVLVGASVASAIRWTARICRGEVTVEKSTTNEIVRISMTKRDYEVQEPEDENTRQLLKAELAENIKGKFVWKNALEAVRYLVVGHSPTGILDHRTNIDPDCEPLLTKPIALAADQGTRGQILDMVLEACGAETKFLDGVLYITSKGQSAPRAKDQGQ